MKVLRIADSLSKASSPMLECVHFGRPFKSSYYELDDWLLSPIEREQQTVRRIRKYLRAVACRKSALTLPTPA